MIDHLYRLLTCPACGASPEPGLERCPGCNRTVIGARGGLDLLADDLRPAADTFAVQYQALREREGWTGASGREDPEGGRPSLWQGRLGMVSEAAALLARERPDGSRPVIADVGSGGGWAARLLRPADVIAFDLLDVAPGDATLTVRADMRRLPLRAASVDAALYAASLHYAPVPEGVPEAARVLRPGGLMVAVDSPMYSGARSSANAASRAAAYYAASGYTELADRYHPIDALDLRAALVASGFQVERLRAGGGPLARLPGLGRKGPASLVVARRLG